MDDIAEKAREIFADLDSGTRESLTTYFRRAVYADQLLNLLGDVTPYGWSRWTALVAAQNRERDPTRTKELAEQRKQVAAAREAQGRPVWEFIREHRELLRTVEHEHHIGSGEIEDDSPAAHHPKRWFRSRELTALRALENCPILGTECIEAARSVFIEARAAIYQKLNEIMLQHVPESHPLRRSSAAPAQQLTADVVTKRDGAVRETVRKILAALDKPVRKLGTIALRAGLTENEVKKRSKSLQDNKLIERDGEGMWHRTAKGDNALK